MTMSVELSKVYKKLKGTSEKYINRIKHSKIVCEEVVDLDLFDALYLTSEVECKEGVFRSVDTLVIDDRAEQLFQKRNPECINYEIWSKAAEQHCSRITFDKEVEGDACEITLEIEVDD